VVVVVLAAVVVVVQLIKQKQKNSSNLLSFTKYHQIIKKEDVAILSLQALQRNRQQSKVKRSYFTGKATDITWTTSDIQKPARYRPIVQCFDAASSTESQAQRVVKHRLFHAL